ncbi:hypothetical protein ACHWQZ_G007715 [Mnemiopsis leidyi]
MVVDTELTTRQNSREKSSGGGEGRNRGAGRRRNNKSGTVEGRDSGPSKRRSTESLKGTANVLKATVRFSSLRSGLGQEMNECVQVLDTAQENLQESCEVHFDTSQIISRPDFLDNLLSKTSQDHEVTMSCQLANSQFCDGFSDCLTDECCCHDSQIDVFYCADGSGCIASSQICDSIQDCTDGSDECFCSDHIILSFPDISEKTCMSEVHFCEVKAFLEFDDRSKFENTCVEKMGHRKITPLESCLVKALEDDQLLFISKPMSVTQEYCKKNCSHVSGFNSGWERYCDTVKKGNVVDFDFLCDGNNFEEYFHISKVCDGHNDCANSVDEIGCPLSERFYCNPNVTSEWVSEDKVCDNVKDCANGADECGTCQYEVLSSPESLIRSKIVVAVTSLMGILIISLNIREGYMCWNLKCTTKSKAVDRILLLQVFFYDTFMGVYLLSIVLATFVLKYEDDYCKLEQKWRASNYCSTLGVIFSFSSHGSLLAIASVSATRFLKCQNVVPNVKERAVIAVSGLVTVLNLFHSLLPLLPLPAVKDVFRTDLYLTNLEDNPFFSSNPINISILAELYIGMLHRERGFASNMIDELTNVTSNREMFDVFEISYYGNTGLCVHNIFKEHGGQESFKTYKHLYCIILLAVLSSVSTAYIKIVQKQRKVATAAHSIDVSLQARQDAKSATLATKVALMIASQLICWIPFLMVVLYFEYISTNPASPMVFEVFALVVLPINSFLNPVYYSELYKNMKNWVNGSWRRFVNILSPI